MYARRHAAALAMTCACMLAAPALAQNNDKELIQEMMRRATAREPEAGFCASVDWPSYRKPQEAARMYDLDKVGGVRPSVHRYKSHGCGVARTTAVTFPNGRRCVTETGCAWSTPPAGRPWPSVPTLPPAPGDACAASWGARLSHRGRGC